MPSGDDSLDSGELKALADKVKSDTGKDIRQDLSKLDTDGDGKVTQAEFQAGRPQPLRGAGGPPPAGDPGEAGAVAGTASAAGAQQTQSYDPADTNQDGVVSEMERLAAQLKELSTQDYSSGAGDTQNQLIAQLARKLYDQISSKFLNQEGSSTVSLSA